MLVETLYNEVAINCGFPTYIDESSTPETTRFLLEMMNQALLNTIDNVYISQNVLEKRDTIVMKPGQDIYPIDGMVKRIQYLQGQDKLSGKYIRFNYGNDDPGFIPPANKYGYPTTYVVDRGNIRFLPIPDKAYAVKVTTSTTNLVWANDDTSRNSIIDVKDSIMASKDFCDIIVLKACAYVLGRCNNKNAEFYNTLASQRLGTFLERDSNSLEKPSLYNPVQGHYNSRQGLLGGYPYRGYRDGLI